MVKKSTPRSIKKKSPRRVQTRKAPARPARAQPPTTTEAPIRTPVSIVQSMDQDDLDQALATGQHRADLEDYFGPELYRELSILAGEALRRSVRGGPPVAILPGIMGSELSIKQGGGDQLIWLSVMQVILGRTRALKLGGAGDKSVRATGVLERYYTKLRLRLQSKGYDARFIPFDWRKSIDELGAALLKEISPAERGRIHLVCHSMGGLVARAAAKTDRRAFQRVIQLGTPNHGSFAPVTALRGVNPTARKVAALDATQDIDDYVQLFASFPGLLQMIPNPARYTTSDLFNLGNWPKGSSTIVTAAVLAKAKKVAQTALFNGDKDFTLIAGVDQETIVGVELDAAKTEFTYSLSDEGDGTVPLDFARLDNVKTFFIAEEHGALPNNTRVADAVDDIIRTGSTTLLSDTRAMRGVPAERKVSESTLDAEAERESVGGHVPTSHEVRHLLDEFLSVSSKDREAFSPTDIVAAAPGNEAPAAQTRSRNIVVGRRRQRALEIKLAHGSITEVDARAIVLGIYEKVTPTGAAAALDEALGGVIRRYIDRRMFNGALGEVTIIPTVRRQLRTEFVVFTGLGSFDQFSPSQLQTVGTNLARMLVDTSIEDIAMVPFGGGAGFANDVILRNFLQGFFAGLADADTDQTFRRVTICEIDDGKYATLVDEVLALTTINLFEDIEVTVCQIDLRKRPEAPSFARAGAPRRAEQIYLIARRSSSKLNISPEKGDLMECAILGGGASAAILSDRHEIDPSLLDVDFRKLDEGKFSSAELESLGDRIASKIIGPKISGALAEAFERTPDAALIVLHDAGASRVPWEALRFGKRRPALSGGLSRRYMSHDLSVAKWLSARTIDDRLDILLVVNPTEDLAGAEREGELVEAIVTPVPGVRLMKVQRADATKARLMNLFQSGQFDVVHYAGHAFFDPVVRHRSGILCAGGRDVLSGLDLAGLATLPALMFCNACQSAQIRMRPDGRRQRAAKRSVETEIGRNVSFAESFLRGGIANYVGTHWSVGDDPAEAFAKIFYTRLAAGASMNEAITKARHEVESKGSKDWADYIHYGDPTFVLKAGEGVN